MAIVKNKSTDQNRAFWEHVEAVSAHVNTWPEWRDRIMQAKFHLHDKVESTDGLNGRIVEITLLRREDVIAYGILVPAAKGRKATVFYRSEDDILRRPA
jgi:hypothetical protein